jgi:hypothetical protein
MIKERQMSIGKQITEQLRRLADGDRTVLEAGTENTLLVLDAPLRAQLEFSDHDRYSVALRELTIGVGGAAPLDARSYLSATAAEVARRLSFLEEPLAVWELDGGERTAQLRSSPPLREGDAVAYWEVTLWASSTSTGQAGDESGARAVRYHWSLGMAEREVLVYPATFGLIARVADGLADALRGDPE